ncbi:MAG: hypothetical protein V3R51_04455 [Gammaproteobacteria bacterium]
MGADQMLLDQRHRTGWFPATTQLKVLYRGRERDETTERII